MHWFLLFNFKNNICIWKPLSDLTRLTSIREVDIIILHINLIPQQNPRSPQCYTDHHLTPQVPNTAHFSVFPALPHKQLQTTRLVELGLLGAGKH